MKTKTMYSPKREGTANDWSANKLIEQKPKLKKITTVNEYGDKTTKRLKVC